MADAYVECPVPGGGSRSVRISSPDRVLWPAEGITKLELATYVRDVGAALLERIGGRPVTLQPVSYTHLDVYKRQRCTRW